MRAGGTGLPELDTTNTVRRRTLNGGDQDQGITKQGVLDSNGDSNSSDRRPASAIYKCPECSRTLTWPIATWDMFGLKTDAQQGKRCSNAYCKEPKIVRRPRGCSLGCSSLPFSSVHKGSHTRPDLWHER